MSEASGLVASASLPMLRAIRSYRERYTGLLLESAGDCDHDSGYAGGGDGGSDAGGVKPTAINRLVRNLTLKVGGRSGRREGAEGGGGVQAVAARNKSFAAASFTVVGAGSVSSARTGASESAMRPVFES